MISEKTVELNLTTELVNWLYSKTKIRPYILAPSQRQEGTLGFDATLGFPGAGIPFLLQYKRAEFRVRSGEYLYHLNGNVTNDQHLRLFLLELMGWQVFYALPKFHLPSEVVSNRQHLLPRTLYLKPSSMIPATGMTGNHEVRYNIASGRITIHSEEGKEIEGQFTFTDFVDLFEADQDYSESLLPFVKDFNAVFANEKPFIRDQKELRSVSDNDHTLFNGLSIIIKPQ